MSRRTRFTPPGRGDGTTSVYSQSHFEGLGVGRCGIGQQLANVGEHYRQRQAVKVCSVCGKIATHYVRVKREFTGFCRKHKPEGSGGSTSGPQERSR